MIKIKSFGFRQSFGLIVAGSAFLLVLSLLVNSSVVSANTGAQPVFNSPVNLSNDGGTAKDPIVANAGDNVYSAWTEGSGGILFRASSDGGSSWSPPLSQPAMMISPKGGTPQYPLMTANGSDVYVTWSQTVGTAGLQVFEATSANNGASFTTRQLTSGSPSGGFITPVIASWGSDIIIAYSAGGPSYLITSTNGGSTWSNPLQYSGGHEPQVAIFGTYMYAISDGNYVYVSANDGSSWRHSHPSGLEGCCSHEPWLAASGKNVYAVWEGKGNQSAVFASASNNYGMTWKTQNLSLSEPDSWAPMVGAYGNSVWVAWHNYPGGALAHEWVTTSTNAGATWSTPVSISGKGYWVGWPWEVSTTDGKNVYVIWPEQVSSNPNYAVVRASYSGDGGTTWSSTPGIDVSQNSNGQAAPENDIADAAISCYGTTAFAVWQFTSTTGTNQVFFSSSSI